MPKEASMEVLGLIPARGGSKSIPYKNVVELGGHPMLAYVHEAARRASSIGRILCSTEDQRIACVCAGLGLEVVERPLELADDDTHIIAVLKELIARLDDQGYRPDAVALLQVTSPFLLPEHIDGCVELLKKNPEARSAQTVAAMPHNFHAYNQRHIVDGEVRFRFEDERRECYNKQTKPKFYTFGNIVVTRTEALKDGDTCFAAPSLPFEIPRAYALDVDTPEDLDVAEWYLQTGKVSIAAFGKGR
ncbi:acylneuraminate cytidylyltransferase [Alkalidesulfovibrio alkalitolerans DSM 16529]|uniref:Acylneuraminate cytidylyltransferase n=2 Tax=Alkalidesulfovibrio alkalitolerans TaxID=293256 RepID=S7TG10_9BACT|nr:acylneuraminate cytidylyltransferase [Alkalidesulfovibrio alkalitolerans DSM 16529]